MRWTDPLQGWGKMMVQERGAQCMSQIAFQSAVGMHSRSANPSCLNRHATPSSVTQRLGSPQTPPSARPRCHPHTRGPDRRSVGQRGLAGSMTWRGQRAASLVDGMRAPTCAQLVPTWQRPTK